MESKDWEKQRVEGKVGFKDMEKKDWELQREENWGKIREGRFSRWYGWRRGFRVIWRKDGRKVGGEEWQGLGWEAK